MDVSVELMESTKSKQLFLVDGFKFRIHKVMKDGTLRCACSKKTCKAYLKLSNDYKVVECDLNHNHEKDHIQKLNRQKLSNKLKRKAIEDISCRPSKLIRRELLQDGDVSTLTAEDVNLIRYNLHRARSKARSKQEAQENTTNQVENIDDVSNVNLFYKEFIYPS